MRKSATSLILAVSSLAAHSQPSSAPLNIYDGFETSALSDFWETLPLAPGSAAIQSSIVRAGHSGLRITLKPHDLFEAGSNGNQDSERDEILENRRLVSRENIPYEFSWSMYLPRDFPIVPVRLVVAQWKQYCGLDSAAPCSDDSPVLAVRYIGGVLYITQDIGHKYIVLYEEKRDLRGSWLDLRFRVRFTCQSIGLVQAWLDGKQVIDFRGVTANSESALTGYRSPGRFYFKMGLYRNAMSQPMTIYLDEYRKRALRADELSDSSAVR
ncbi:MAG: polysaccharide lyase [Terracidiphilus sp.]